jgi:hypothetical protein
MPAKAGIQAADIHRVALDPRFRGGDGGPGDEVLIEPVGEGELQLRTRRQAIKEAQSIIARHVPKTHDLVAELIAERREKAGRE